MRSFAGGILLGLTVALGFGFFMVTPSLEGPPARDAVARGAPRVEAQRGTSTRSVRGCDAEEASLGAEIAALTTELEARRLGVRFSESRLRQLGGAPIPWPEVHDPRLAPETFEALMEEAALAVSDHAELIDVDCSEYPCIAYIGQPPEDGGSGSVWSAVREALGPLDGIQERTSFSVVDGWHVTATAAWEDDVQPDIEARVGRRSRSWSSGTPMSP